MNEWVAVKRSPVSSTSMLARMTKLAPDPGPPARPANVTVAGRAPVASHAAAVAPSEPMLIAVPSAA